MLFISTDLDLCNIQYDVQLFGVMNSTPSVTLQHLQRAVSVSVLTPYTPNLKKYILRIF